MFGVGSSVVPMVYNVPNVLCSNFSLNLEIKDKKDRTPLWLALTVPDDKINPEDEDSVAGRLSAAGASPDSIETSSGKKYM